MNIINQAYSLLSDFVQPQTRKLLTLAGFLFVSLKSLDLLRSFYRTFLVIGHNLPKRYGPGSWALITGAAGGIGSAFADELGAKGFNLVLIDVNEQRLQEVAVTIKAKYPSIMTKTVTCNFGHSWMEGFYDGLMEQLQGLDISLLVNNVGTLNAPALFHNIPEESILNTLTVNMLPMTILTRRLIPYMMKRPERSGIINISSMTGVLPSSISVVYSASKAYVDFFSRAIEKDVKDKIDIISIRPDAVSTGMLGSPKLGTYVISGHDVAQAALRKLGNVSYAFGDWRHEIKVQLAKDPTIKKFFVWHFRTRVMRRT